MNRRNFLLLSSLSITLSQLTYAKGIEPKSALVLEEVYNILFPKTKHMPSAKEFGVVNYLRQNIHHQYFDKNDANLILQGAIDFNDSFTNFLTASKEEKTQMITDASQNSYGNEWLSTLLRYGFEALLSDPIYGGNTNGIGWQALKHSPGLPRPQVTYARRV